MTTQNLEHTLQYLTALSELPEPSALKRLIDDLRPSSNDADVANAKLDELIALLKANETYRTGLATFILQLIQQYRQISLYTDTGIASDDTFFASINKLAIHRLLPLLPEEGSIVELVAYLFDKHDDDEWLENIDNDKLTELIALTSADHADNAHLELIANAKNSLLNAVVILSYRISGTGLHPNLMQAYPQLLNYSAAFVAQNQEAVLFVDEYRKRYELDAPTDTKPPEEIDPAPLLVMLGQCQDIVNTIRKRIYKTGISIRTTNMLVRLEQSITRMYKLIGMLSPDPKTRHEATAKLIYTIIYTAQSRYRFSSLLASNTNLLSRKVTENASRVGENYISTDKAGFRKMYKKAAIGGFFIAFMATMKTLAYHLALAPVGRAFVNSMIYGLGFVTIHIARGTVATKQPAMTAAAIASTISNSTGKKTAQLSKLSELIVDIMRTQFIAIMGNISIAMPVALLIAFAWNSYYGTPMIDSKMAGHLLHDLDPIRSLALPHAAIAGVFLFLSGLISGYYDNLSAYNQVGERLRRHWLLLKLLPKKWLDTMSTFVENNLGAIMGNFIFGCFLGSTATIGYMLGLPIDIRHIAFASANFVHGVFYLSPADLTPVVAITAFIGVLLIGFVNLMVSFSLALMVALRAKGVRMFEWQELGRLVFKHFKTRPQDFVWPRKESIKYAGLDSDGQMIFENVENKERTIGDNYVVRRLSKKKPNVEPLPTEVKTDAQGADLIVEKPVTSPENTAQPTDKADTITPLPKPDKPPQLPK